MAAPSGLFYEAAKQRGWITVLRMLAVALGADRGVLLAAAPSDLVTETSAIEFLVSRNGDAAPTIDFSTPEIESLRQRFHECFEAASAETEIVAQRRTDPATTFFAVPLFRPDGPRCGSLTLFGNWTAPFSSTLRPIFDEAKTAIEASFPSVLELRGLDETNFYGCVDLVQDSLEDHQLGFWMLKVDDLSNPAAAMVYLSRSSEYLKGIRSPITFGDYAQYVHPADRGFLFEQLQSLLEGKKIKSIPYRVVVEDGVRFLMLSATPIPNEKGLYTRVFGTTQNITTIRKLENSLSEANHRMRVTMDSARMSFWTLGSDNTVRWPNGITNFDEIACKLGDNGSLPIDDLIQMVVPEDRSDFYGALIEIAQGRVVQDLRYRIKTDTGMRHVVSWIFPVLGENGEMLESFGLMQDVSHTRRIEQELVEQTEHFMKALVVGRMGYWRLNLETRMLQASDTLLSMDVPRPDFPLEEFVPLVHPDDLEAFWGGFQAITLGNEASYSLRLLQNGEFVPFHLYGFPIQDESGQTTVAFGLLQNVSEQKKMERQLNEANQRLTNAMQIGKMGYWKLDWIHRRITTSPELRRIAGFERPEFQIKTLAQMVLPEDLAALRECFDSLQQGRESNVSYRILVDGQVRNIFTCGFPIMDDNGKTSSAFGISQDVTEQKAGERALENYRSYISLIAEIRKSFYNRSEQEIVQTFLEHAVRNFGLDKGWYGVRIGNSIRPIYHAGPSKHFVDVSRIEIDTFPESNFPLSRAIRERAPVAENCLDRDESFITWREFQEASQFQSVLAIPVDFAGKIEAGVVLYSHRTNAFDPLTADYLISCVKELTRISMEKRIWTQQQRTLKKAKETAEAAAQAKTQFLANMSHEIRTPMTSILGYTEMLLNDPAFADENSGGPPVAEPCRSVIEHSRNAAKVVRNNAEYLLSIINDILDFSKMEVGKTTIETIPVPMQQFMHEIAAVHAMQAKNKNLEFTIKALTLLPEKMNTDPLRLKQILVNLIGNAIKFTSEGGVVVSIAWLADDGTEKPAASGSDNGSPKSTPCRGTLRFTVRDTGIGIAPEYLTSLFTPFQQADSSTTRKFGGTGLGLAISKRLILLLGGDLTVSSQTGRGSLFTLTLPQSFPDGTAWISMENHFEFRDGKIHPVQRPSQAGSSETPKIDQPLKGISVLLAEDGKDNQRLFAFLLTKAGAEVVIADNGLIARQLAKEYWQNETPFDVVLMDMQMPVMDGYTATAKLRKEGYQFPIVALTAHAMQDERQRCLSAGCNDYAAKPILRDALIDSVLRNVRKDR